MAGEPLPPADEELLALRTRAPFTTQAHPPPSLHLPPHREQSSTFLIWQELLARMKSPEEYVVRALPFP